MQSNELGANNKRVDHAALHKAYHRALSTTLVGAEEPLDRLQIKGADRFDLLERLSTNTFKTQDPGSHMRTALLEPNGRLIDLLDVFIREDSLELFISKDNAETVETWLKDHIFFQDDAHVKRMDPCPAIVTVLGPAADELLEIHFGTSLKFNKDRFCSLEGTLILPIRWSKVSGYRMIARYEEVAERLSGLLDPLNSAAEQQAIEALRIEAGIPKRGHEIRPGVIPLEVGLSEAVSFSKGCYVGQEVIARLESRGELAGRLAGIRLSAPAVPELALEQAGRTIGTLTSCALSPENGWIGLGIVRTRRWDPSSGDLTIQGSSFSFTELPFNPA
jgi:aminomethyltransferase